MISRLRHEERGAVVAWVVLWIPLLIVIATFVIDVGNWWTHKRHLQNQVDAGALAAGAGYLLPDCQTSSALQDKMADEALSYSGTTRRIAAGNSPTTRNPQLSNSANVFVTINSPTYWDGPVERRRAGLLRRRRPVLPAHKRHQGTLDRRQGDGTQPAVADSLSPAASSRGSRRARGSRSRRRSFSRTRCHSPSRTSIRRWSRRRSIDECTGPRCRSGT